MLRAVSQKCTSADLWLKAAHLLAKVLSIVLHHSEYSRFEELEGCVLCMKIPGRFCPERFHSFLFFSLIKSQTTASSTLKKKNFVFQKRQVTHFLKTNHFKFSIQHQYPL